MEKPKNLYLCHAKAGEFYVIAENYLHAHAKIKEKLNEYCPFSNKKEITRIDLISKEAKDSSGRTYLDGKLNKLVV